jgi:predicted RNA polymerase sigma factor
VLAGLAPDEPEVHGLVALMEVQASRNAARVGPHGEPVPLLEQNRGRWDQLLIRRGYAALLRAERLGGPVGPYVLQVSIAALYGNLARLTPTPVVELNRAVAVAMAYGPERGLAIVDAVAADPALRDYHLLPTVRGDLLARLGRAGDARAEFERAAALTRNERERAVLESRAAALADRTWQGRLDTA